MLNIMDHFSFQIIGDGFYFTGKILSLFFNQLYTFHFCICLIVCHWSNKTENVT